AEHRLAVRRVTAERAAFNFVSHDSFFVTRRGKLVRAVDSKLFVFAGGDTHAQPQVDGAQAVADFLQRRFAEVADLQQLVFRPADEIAHGIDPFGLEAVRRPDRQVEFGQTAVEFLFHLEIDGRVTGRFEHAAETHVGRKFRAGFAVRDERAEMLAENFRRFDEGHLRIDRAVRPDFENELVVIRPLADARVFDFVAHADDGRINRIERDDADFRFAVGVLGRGDVAAAVVDGEFHHERHVVGHRGDDEILVDDLHLAVGDDVLASHHAALAAFDPQRLGLDAVVFDDERFEVEDDVRHVFDHAGNRGEFVLHALNLHAGDRAAFEAGE